MTIKKAYVDGPYGQIHYVSGTSGIPLILLHQSPTSSVQYSEVMELLIDRGFRPIAVDTPGHGMSDPPDFEPSIKDYAQAIISLLDALDINSCHILGHHTGAQVATEVAILDDRIKSIILNTPLLLNDDERQDFLNQIVPLEKKFKPKENGEHMMEVWNLRASFCEGFIPEVMHKHIIANLQRLDIGWHGHNACFSYDHNKSIQLIKQPAMVLSNTGDPFVKYAKRVSDIRPDIRYKELTGGTIDIIDEQSEEWSEVVTSFIQEIM
jgi:pimeloyl-ACP methyl ester carboxylesterase